MTLLDLFLRLCFAGFSLILLLVSIFAYLRYKSARLTFVMLAFLIYAATSLLVLLSGLFGISGFEMSAAVVALNIGILICLYLSLLKR